VNLFELEHNKVAVSAEALLIKEFKDVWSRDTSRTKDNALEEFAYIYYLIDYKSVYKQYDESARSSKIIADVISKKGWKPDKLIENACQKYDELQQTPSMGLLRDAETALDKIRSYFRTVDVTEDDTGKVTATLISNVEKLGNLIKGLSSLREIVEKEMSEVMRVRGGGKMSLREMPKR
jgi:hypothetical protein